MAAVPMAIQVYSKAPATPSNCGGKLGAKNSAGPPERKNPAGHSAPAGLSFDTQLRVRQPVRMRIGFDTVRNLKIGGSTGVERLRPQAKTSGQKRSKSRPPHAWVESRWYYNFQISFDWTTSFLSDASIIRRVRKRVNFFLTIMNKDALALGDTLSLLVRQGDKMAREKPRKIPQPIDSTDDADWCTDCL